MRLAWRRPCRRWYRSASRKDRARPTGRQRLGKPAYPRFYLLFGQRAETEQDCPHGRIAKPAIAPGHRCLETTLAGEVGECSR
jgi:hypothetical protein